METIVTAFTKIEQLEGAAIQIILKPAAESCKKSILNIRKSLMEGKDLK